MTTRTPDKTTLPIRETSEKRLEDYRPVVGDEATEEILALAKPLRGKRILHVNSSGFGGGVADLLEALVPLLNDIGLRAEWRIIRGDESFFDVTKAMHNTLQGKPTPWTQEMWNTWLRFNEQNSLELSPHYDVIIIHDPQPAALLYYLRERNGTGPARWLWRCHIDLTDMPRSLWRRLLPYLQFYDGVEFSMGEFVERSLVGPSIFISTPAIDPLNPKNVPLSRRAAAKELAAFGIDTRRPIMAQISRFDPWKDPLGVVDVYRWVKKDVPNLQLVMIGPTAADDPEGLLFFELTARRAGEDPDIHLLTNFKGAGDLTVNAVQTRADVIVQKSIREGFGLSVSGSLWHAKPVVAGRAGGIVMQVLDGQTGFLAESTEEFAAKVSSLLRDPGLSRKMGRKAKEHVRRNFLVTRYLRDNLKTYSSLLGG